MTGHDQLWKDLIRAFFGDFVRIVVPRMAQDLRLDEARFLKDEYFTDVPRGRRQLLDLVAEVGSRTGDPEIVLVHIEVEACTRKAMERRMWRYAMQLRLRHHRPVVPRRATPAGVPATDRPGATARRGAALPAGQLCEDLRTIG